MTGDDGFCAANAYLDDQLTVLGDWHARQYITLELSGFDDEREPAWAALTSHEARELAFRLLVVAELADHRARGEDLP